MVSILYREALAGLETSLHASLDTGLSEVCVDILPGQVYKNVTSELGLSCDDLKVLLQYFCENLPHCKSATEAWSVSCRSLQLRGSVIPLNDIPKILGRVKTLAQHAAQLASTDVARRAGMSPAKAKELLRKHATSPIPPYVESILRTAPLGKYLIWATFNESSKDSSPFDGVMSHSDLLSSLGLGMIGVDEPLIILVWDHQRTGAPTLHRPTIADAADYPYFRPSKDMSIPWGKTFPLNSASNEGHPEVVMAETTCIGINLPYSVVDPTKI